MVVVGALSLVAPSARGFIIDPNAAAPWLSTASGSRTGNGAPATLTWSIVPDGTSTINADGLTTASSNLVAFMNSNFNGNAAQTDLTLQPWFRLFQNSFDRWAQLGGVNYVYEPHDDGSSHPGLSGALGVRGDVRIGGVNVDGAGGTLAFTYLPAGGGDMVVDTGDGVYFKDSINDFRGFRDTIMHEIGHSFGMQHVNSNSELLLESVTNTNFDGPQLDEVRAVQYYFGDVNEKSHSGAGNGAASLATTLGAIASGGTRSVGAAANVPTQAIAGTATDFVSISNAGDVDFYSFTVSAASRLAATLTPRGGVFDQAGQGQTPTTFDANARNNLALTLIDSSGTNVLGTADATLAGGMESFVNLVLPSAGTYYARVSGADPNIQLYELSLTPTTFAAPEPATGGMAFVIAAVLVRRQRDRAANGVLRRGLERLP